MKQKTTETVERDIARLCRSNLEPRTLWNEVLKKLHKVVPIDVTFFSTVDPATLLFTSSVADDILLRATPQFLENEFLQTDVNKFRHLARKSLPIDTLRHATRDDLESSPRFRDILAPLGLGDELRVALRSNSACWGFLCLHRDRSGPPFTAADVATLSRLAVSLAEGISGSILVAG